VLVGGTALALRLTHRLSEDLDFMTTDRLNQGVVYQILKSLKRGGCKTFTKIETVHKALLLSADGADINDYSQNWRVDGVKLSFFVKQLQPESAQQALREKLQSGPVEGLDTGRIRVATEKCLFSLKSQLLAERLTSRDLFDLKTLLETGRYSFDDLLAEAKALGANPEFVKERIFAGPLQVNDPKVNTPDGAVIDIETVRNWFTEVINEFERRKATPLRSFEGRVRK
jgi:predicted nucleotidyltransferase component of viral defense system